MNNRFIAETSPALLRQLADRIERGEDIPAYAVVVEESEGFARAFHTGDDIYALAGAVQNVNRVILQELDSDDYDH